MNNPEGNNLPDEFKAEAEHNAKGQVEHFKKFVDRDAAQPSFSAYFVITDKFHSEMHAKFLEQLSALGFVNQHPPTLDVVQVMQAGDVLLFRQGYEQATQSADGYELGGVSSYLYFAERKDPTEYVL